jgi:hypothetical protein
MHTYHFLPVEEIIDHIGMQRSNLPSFNQILAENPVKNRSQSWLDSALYPHPVFENLQFSPLGNGSINKPHGS